MLTNDIWQIYRNENVYAIVFVLSLFLLILTGLSSLAASYLNPVKSFVPQMPKLLKSLFPIRDEKRGRQPAPSPVAHQVKAPGSSREGFLVDGWQTAPCVALRLRVRRTAMGGHENRAVRPGEGWWSFFSRDNRAVSTY